LIHFGFQNEHNENINVYAVVPTVPKFKNAVGTENAFIHAVVPNVPTVPKEKR